MKKIVILGIPLVLIVIATAVYLFLNRKQSYTVKAENWHRESTFILGEVEVEKVDSMIFYPSDETVFLAAVRSHNNYLGQLNIPVEGVDNNICDMFYYDNGMFALMNWAKGAYQLRSCSTWFWILDADGVNGSYWYPSPGDYYPDNSLDAQSFERNFDSFFGEFEDCRSSFYSYLQYPEVDIDSEKKIIRCKVYSRSSARVLNDSYVEIDFINKTVVCKLGEDAKCD